ncbi:hydantoinase B/oxoprolinase family protein [Neobacillus drentensis]|uniref:hydantoinase B/oxoprolinase family protein n=1 Tax=Neobacillus drentensis TaxID=220684 RepID=UPI0030027D3E
MTQALHEQELANEFLKNTEFFLGPDAEINSNHRIEPITVREEEAVNKVDDTTIGLVRSKLHTATNETCEMLMQTGAAPGAKWGDLITGIYSATGDLCIASSQGIVLFSTCTQYAVKYIKKYWTRDASVGVNPGDVFMHNDSRYGGIHNADHSMILPIFHNGELIAWAGAIVHEGENGAVEPGGVPSLAESKYMEGLAIPPIKIAENYQLKNDLVTFLQNSVREPKLLQQDIKARLAATVRLQKRMDEIIEEFGVDALVATLRKTLDDTEKEVRRRVSKWQDGTVRSNFYMDGTLRENVLIKGQLEVTKKGETLHFDFTGTAPEFANRAVNGGVIGMAGTIATAFLFYVWPDLPRNQAVVCPFEITIQEKSIINPSNETATSQCMAIGLSVFAALQHALAKFLYSSEERYTKVMAPMYNQISTFLYGGITQNGEIAGNIGADLNGMPGGGRSDMDGEHSLSLSCATMADQGEQEFMEEEIPWMHLSRKLMKDNQGFGKYRGGSGFQEIVAVKDTPFWGLMSTTVGSKFPSVTGLFGGYGCPTYPLAKVKGVNVFKEFQDNPQSFAYDVDEIMNNRTFEGAQYSTHHRGMGLEIVQEGELYIQTQGTGGGYGDVLDREPEKVIQDLEDGLISDYIAQNIYHIVYDSETLVLNVQATNEKRLQEKENRKERGLSFNEFVEKWVTAEPPSTIPWYGSWGDKNVVYGGSPNIKMPANQLMGIVLPDPNVVRIAQLEAQLKELSK